MLVIPTNQPMIREDYPDCIYRTEKEKFDAVGDEIKECYESGRPALVGTISIDKSEKLSQHLKKLGIKHNVLNAKHHEQEAEIIAQAGQMRAVTIATNMAGRGTDIVLGEGVPELGGLHIIGTERHESRRIDNQLRGRSGRQGDGGSSRFFLSLEDDLLRIFGSDKISGLMARLGMENGQPIEHSMVSKAVGNAQRKVEAHNFDIRKHLLEYDDVMNKQREVIYTLRRDILMGQGQKELLYDMADEILDEKLQEVAHKDIYPEEWDIGLVNEYSNRTLDLSVEKNSDQELVIDGKVKLPMDDIDSEKLHNTILDRVFENYDAKEKEVGAEFMRYPERMIMLRVLDNLWRDHLLAMDHLKEGIGLRSYAQKNPLNEYKKEGFDLFREMNFRMKEEICQFLFKAKIDKSAVSSLEANQEKENRKVMEHRGDAGEGQKPKTVRREEKKVGRNDACPCGSGKKYKKCHGK